MKSDDHKSQGPYTARRWKGSSDELQDYIGADLNDPAVNLETRRNWKQVMKDFDEAFKNQERKK